MEKGLTAPALIVLARERARDLHSAFRRLPEEQVIEMVAGGLLGFTQVVRKPWQTDMTTAPKDRPVVGLCHHASDPYFIEDERFTGHLTIYGAHAEYGSHAEDGPHILIWGGSWQDSPEDGGGYIPDWWFVRGTNFEVVANPIAWMDLDDYTDLLAAADEAHPDFPEKEKEGT